MSLTEQIKNNPKLKAFVHWLLIPSGEARPRLWVKWFVNPFLHKRGKGSKVRYRSRMDVLPFNRFELGNQSVIESFCTINNGVGDVIIGDGSLIGMSNVIIGPVTVGNNVIFAQNIVASALNHGYQDVTVPISKQKVVTSQIIIEDDCWIAANSVITAGVTVGKHSVVGGGSVVTKDVPPYSVVAGNPARVIKRYNFDSKQWERA
ncbi:acyltransferase [Mucilaginibacter sp. KACC 22063]|uniref:acyltransferase n=1 Tax=Mucilaginibacter sp. KACC 22063 TaxID=3025666 RepID=UPI002365A6AE|nr:acyltransferase [Mucilaginibacter sp. KACC 22063]WDF53674.1 acyltransferase [Mucilaginibacter sp. KACC 22063]